jgi:uncharacterized membrane protein
MMVRRHGFLRHHLPTKLNGLFFFALTTSIVGFTGGSQVVWTIFIVVFALTTSIVVFVGIDSSQVVWTVFVVFTLTTTIVVSGRSQVVQPSFDIFVGWMLVIVVLAVDIVGRLNRRVKRHGRIVGG